MYCSVEQYPKNYPQPFEIKSFIANIPAYRLLCCSNKAHITTAHCPVLGLRHGAQSRNKICVSRRFWT
ncbi:hypothetical protein HK15_11995 [Acetobacter orientalis]|uniref:Uncharacterized protein n=1 Tax=Acetobacter orientalis TaxID=146474 RepID=A0A252B3V7_9PROT|nr:hypothetical protein HK15_11995 [Acetobacter orientalis]